MRELDLFGHEIPANKPAVDTSEIIIARLPKRPLLHLVEIKEALALSATSPLYAYIDDGRLNAVKISNRYLVSYDNACAFIRSLQK